jgi:hypothetical protein
MPSDNIMIFGDGTWLITWGTNKKAWVLSGSSGMSWASPVASFLPLPTTFTATKLDVPVSNPTQLRTYVCNQVGAGTPIYTVDMPIPSSTTGSQTC